MGWQYLLVSDYLLFLVFIFKIYRGFKYVKSSVKSEHKTDDYMIDPLGEQKYVSLRLMEQREKLQAYLRVTVQFSWFVIIQEFAQVWIFSN